MSPQVRIVNVDRGRAPPSDRYTYQDTSSTQGLGITHTMDLPQTHNPFTQDLIEPDAQAYDPENTLTNEPVGGREDAAFRANFHSSFDTRDEHFSPLKKEAEAFHSLHGQVHPGVHHRSRSKNRSKFYYQQLGSKTPFRSQRNSVNSMKTDQVSQNKSVYLHRYSGNESQQTLSVITNGNMTAREKTKYLSSMVHVSIPVLFLFDDRYLLFLTPVERVFLVKGTRHFQRRGSIPSSEGKIPRASTLPLRYKRTGKKSARYLWKRHEALRGS